jgi:2',3'-cyclic-nucleotide 2'-phosphodiesterase (5'-nucleotidase family)
MQTKYTTLLKSLCFLTVCFWCSCVTQRQAISKSEVHYTIIDTSIQKNTAMTQLLQHYKTNKDSLMNQVIGRSDVPLSKAQPECTMGNFIADAQLVFSQKLNKEVSVSICNYGGIRIPYLSPGNITLGNIYELMPFDNILTIIEIPGKTLKQFCNHMASRGGWPISGLTYQIKDKQAINILVDGKPIHIYTTALSDYIANGGDDCDFLLSCKRKNENVFVRDILIEAIKNLSEQGNPLHITLDKRVRYVE